MTLRSRLSGRARPALLLFAVVASMTGAAGVAQSTPPCVLAELFSADG